MTFYRVHRRLAACLAMLALAMSALAPTLAHAWVAAADESQWIEVCRSSGMVWLKSDGLDAAGQGISDRSGSMPDMDKHCPWCSFHGSMAGLPPAAESVKLVSTDEQLSTAWPDLDLPALVLRGAQARAPPAAS